MKGFDISRISVYRYLFVYFLSFSFQIMRYEQERTEMECGTRYYVGGKISCT